MTAEAMGAFERLNGTEDVAFTDSAVICDSTIPFLAKHLYCILTTCCDENGVAVESRTDLAAYSSMSVRTVDKASKLGVAHGVFTMTRSGSWTSANRYQLLDFQGDVFNPRKVYVERFPHKRRIIPVETTSPVVTNPDKVSRLRALGQRDGWRCTYCSAPLADPTVPGWEQTGFMYPHVDHVMPRARGGSNRIDNLCLACQRCNLRKGDQLLCELPAGWWVQP